MDFARKIAFSYEVYSFFKAVGTMDICIIKYFLDIVSPGNDMLAKLQWLFVKFPEVDLKALGFPDGWEMEPLWKA